jgi:hypothetical protein
MQFSLRSTSTENSATKEAEISNLHLRKRDLVRHIDRHFLSSEYVAHDLARAGRRINWVPGPDPARATRSRTISGDRF